ncbi:DNA-binding protein [Shewanella sp. GutDb-MelDb]|uniref:DNA-binding protein n=1 Tax=Shewanella sp. GutDb-MelDb TaxID=2058316 RepID=UPI000C797185|nr:DNA-binding protein [Shewanella sp. GutDb-MelDb]PKG55177.1 DNA-binding protein [Shewanella sp. GutDb-MelDb]
MKSWLICIDDTDDIGTKGTGEIAEEIANLLAAEQLKTAASSDKCLVTRHQLFVHPDIPYTSHNSAMCFRLETDLSFAAIKQICVSHLLAESAEAADPGLAILDMTSMYDINALIAFGQSTKEAVKTKSQAYELAAELGIDLTEHGGTGQGVIGALAGLGLRLSGQDGRVKGQLEFEHYGDGSTEFELSVADIISMSSLQAVLSDSGDLLSMDERVLLSGKVKAVYRQHMFALLVSQHGDGWVNASKQTLKAY